MKKVSLLFAIILIIGFSFTSCKEVKKAEEVDSREEMIDDMEAVQNEDMETEAAKTEEIAMAQYQCPMQCEEDKTYSEASSCPVCKMDLEKVAQEESHEEASHEEESGQ